jgi:hypothetical protein
MSTPFPSGIRITEFELLLNENKAATESLFTRVKQAVTLGGGTADRWEGNLATEPLDTARAAPMMAFIAAVGRFGSFTVQDPLNKGVTSGQSTALVNGAGQTGQALAMDTMPNSITIAKAGEYFQVGSEYKILTADLVTNGSGQATAQFRPALRASPADNATVTFAGAVLTAIITVIPSKKPDENLLMPFRLAFEEAL